MAAQKFGVPAEHLTVVNGTISTPEKRAITYQELIGSKRFNLPLSTTAKRRSQSEWTVLGKPIPSLDRVALMTGQFEFVHNVRVPGMLHGRVVRPPQMGATLISVDESSVRHIPGMVKVVARKDFVGVVAEKQWQAVQAASALKVNWNPGPTLPAQSSIFESMRKQPSRDALIVDSRDVEQHLATAATVLKATYTYPYQMHGSIGASCAVADFKDNHATIWSPTQSAYPTRSIVAKILNLPLENVHVIFVRGAGCYGLNGADTVSFDAAVMSHAVGRPVRVQLSRQDEMAWENFGAACVIDQRAGIDQAGTITAWECENWLMSRGGRPGYDQPGNVITGMLLGYSGEPFHPRTAAEPSGELRNQSNAVPSYVRGCVRGKCGGVGNIRSERVLTHALESPFFTGPLRSPLRLQNTFAHESFMDEICAHAKADPVAFRLQHLQDERMLDVVKVVAEAAGWEKRPSPKNSRPGSGMASGRGIACVAYEGDNGYAALVAEVNVDLASGKIQPKRFVVAIDAGPVSNPDGLRNQSEGGILQGTSRALVEEVTWDDKQVTSRDWSTYHSLHLDFEPPVIEVKLINRTGVPATGAGETPITLVAAAIGNAVFDATGVRLRSAPFTPERVKGALV
jgi:CO/xanthine dehydrogenase Mo-binding subunit